MAVTSVPVDLGGDENREKADNGDDEMEDWRRSEIHLGPENILGSISRLCISFKFNKMSLLFVLLPNDFKENTVSRIPLDRLNWF